MVVGGGTGMHPWSVATEHTGSVTDSGGPAATFRCRECLLRTGDSAALAVVGLVDLPYVVGGDDMIGDTFGRPVVLVRDVRRHRRSPMVRVNDLHPQAAPLLGAVLVELLPKLRHSTVPGDVRPALRPVMPDDTSRVVVECSRGHRVQVTRAQLVRLAEGAERELPVRRSSGPGRARRPLPGHAPGGRARTG